MKTPPTPPTPAPKGQRLSTTVDFSSTSADLLREISGATQRVELVGPTGSPSDRIALWTAVRAGSQAISFRAYNEFIRRVLVDKTSRAADETQLSSRSYSHLGVDAYNLLRDATRVFVALNCGTLGDPPRDARTGLEMPGSTLVAGEVQHRGSPITYDELARELEPLLHGKATPYLERIAEALLAFTGGRLLNNSFGVGVVQQRLQNPCLVELIWSYWMEEGAVVQAINAIALRFQNRHGRGDYDPLVHLKLDSLRPLANILWGYIQDEIGRLTLARRVYEYDHEYGLTLLGRAVPQLRSADSRSKFIEAFHNLLYSTTRFFKEDDDKTVVADGFPLLNALKEVHLLLAQGAHNQFGDLPATARVEMLLQQWLLSRPEIREYLGAPPAVPYPEDWMGVVDTMKALQGWSDISVMHFRDLAIFGEQLLLSIRHEDWSDATARTAADAAGWARSWRSEIFTYIHSYRAVTGVDLSSDVTDTRSASNRYLQPSVLHRRRTELQRGARNGEPAMNFGRRLVPN